MPVMVTERHPQPFRPPLYAGHDAVIPLTQEQLAEMAGTSRVTVNRVLREEQARGTVDLRRRRTVMLDADAIARHAR